MLERPLIVQRDGTILLDSFHPDFEHARQKLSVYADLLQSAGPMHIYRMTKLSLWNAAANCKTADDWLAYLKKNSKFGIPEELQQEILQWMGRYGRVRLQSYSEQPTQLLLSWDCETSNELQWISSNQTIQPYIITKLAENKWVLQAEGRGWIKQELAKKGWPVIDEAGFHTGEALEIKWGEAKDSGYAFKLRDYQIEAIDKFLSPNGWHGGSGVIVAPCGAGKTIIGIGVITACKSETLVLTANTTSVRQWKQELLNKTCLNEDQIGEYTGEKKEVCPVTIATYQILTYRSSKGEVFEHMQLFRKRNWGLIIYDEVHLLPAPVFRVTAELQSKRRLGLTATLIREDGKETDVFSLVGPKRYEVGWKQLENQGYIAKAKCIEVKVPYDQAWMHKYLSCPGKEKHRFAGENPHKLEVVKWLLEKHRDEGILVIGSYLDQLQTIASSFCLPLITGNMSKEVREELYRQFREGKIRCLAVSKVANLAVDLPAASVAIQVSGSFGSRQEEAQRLGRILRTKGRGKTAYFYTLVTEHTREEQFAKNRQLFLMEQGYTYKIHRWTKEECHFENANVFEASSPRTSSSDSSASPNPIFARSRK